MQKPVIAVFDAGKTNKKLFLFDEEYNIVYEKSARFTETVDEDGDPCENLESLRLSVFTSLREVSRLGDFCIKAVNFSAYGASLVHVDANGKTFCPLYNYLKPYPEHLKKQFYSLYGGEERLSRETASPVLGSLNAGMQLYRLKYEKPGLFKKISYALHLPQYLSFLVSGRACSELTSLGCHTHLWNYEEKDYHSWVKAEGIVEKMAPLAPSDEVVPPADSDADYVVGRGLHDSSAALIPYLVNFRDPFALISTGTWCITLNPFNTSALTASELKQDCLCYMQYKGIPVKASRFFGGYVHEQQVKRIAAHFNQNAVRYRTMSFDRDIVYKLQQKQASTPEAVHPGQAYPRDFAKRDLATFASDTEAYHQLVLDLVASQVASSQLVLAGSEVRRIFVDGGFSRNSIYMNLLALAYPGKEVYAASMAQGTAIGAALAVHHHWNTKPLPSDLIALKYYAASQELKPQ